MTSSSSSGARVADKSSAYPSNRAPNRHQQDVLAVHPADLIQACLLTEVELGELKKVGKEIAESLRERLKADVTLHGKTLVVPDMVQGRRLGVKDLKVQVKHVLHHLHFSEEYRVLAEHQKIRIVRLEEKERRAEREGTAPPPTQTLPYFFPGS